MAAYEDRPRRYSRGPPLADRPRRVEDDRFEFRLREDRYGPPALRPKSHDEEEDDFLVYTDEPRRRVESPPPRPRLLRRQSSLDTFDRHASRKRNQRRYYDRPRVPVMPRQRSPSSRRYDADFYEDIRIAEPDYYGDEEYREFRDREYPASRRRPSSPSRYHDRLVEEVFEKPYPRRGKTRMPRKLVNTSAIIELGYPFQEEVRISYSIGACVKSMPNE